jgi:hypothetical protein
MTQSGHYDWRGLFARNARADRMSDLTPAGAMSKFHQPDDKKPALMWRAHFEVSGRRRQLIRPPTAATAKNRVHSAIGR